MTKNEAEESHAAGSMETSSPADSMKPSGHRARYAKVYGFVGFNRAYNFPLWVIFAGAMFGFSLSRLYVYNYDEIFPTTIEPGWWYYFRQGTNRVGMIMHLATCLPAGLLMVLEFTPKIRHKFLLFHRINGYLVLLLLIVSNAGALIILRHNDNGLRIATQSAEAFLVIITTIGMSLAWWNIRRKQIDQHRAWMLRTMFYFGTIITSRVCTNISAYILTSLGDYYSIWTCHELDFLFNRFGMNGTLEARYPQCLIPNGTTDGRVVVNAARLLTEPERFGSSISLPFGAMLWFATVLHVIGVEIYLNLTPRESERLRRISYERQLEAGFKNPGSAGLTSDRWGDAETYRPS